MGSGPSIVLNSPGRNRYRRPVKCVFCPVAVRATTVSRTGTMLDRPDPSARSHLGLAPRVQRVVHEESAVQESIVVVLDQETADTDREESRPNLVGAQVAGYVGGVHDFGQSSQCVVLSKTKLVYQYLERALIAPMRVRGPRGVEGVATC